MTLVIIVICLGLERYLNAGAMLGRFNWFSSYLGLIEKFYKPKNGPSAWIHYILVLLPLWIVVLLAFWLLSHTLGNLGRFILATAILLYCMGPIDLYHQMQAYAKAVETNDDATEAEIVSTLDLSDSKDSSRAMTQAMFLAANQRLFAVLFWYLLLGPTGALLYRVTSLLVPIQPEVSAMVKNILDWVPVRFEGLFFGLVGDFGACFGPLFKRLFGGANSTREILTDCSVLALGLDSQAESQDPTEYQNALFMIDRATIVGLVLVAVFTLGYWLA